MVRSSISCLCALHHYNSHVVPAHTGPGLLFVPTPSTRIPSFPSSILSTRWTKHLQRGTSIFNVGLSILWGQALYQLLLVAALIAASGAIPLNDEILPEDNEFISVERVQSAQQVEGHEAETDEPMSQGEVPLDEEELDDHGATEQAPSNDKLVVPEVIDRCHTESIADSLHPVIHGLSLSS